MSKFATVLLKIIMVIAFIGIIVFVAFAIITNQNVSYEAYNYISSYYQNSDFSSFESKVNSNMRETYDDGQEWHGNIDTYAIFLNTAIRELNNGSKHFLNYLSCEKDLTKGEQDNLKNLFNKYTSSYDNAKKAYDDYMVSYQDADNQFNHHHDESDVALSIVKSKCIYFVEIYADCYVQGSKFFKALVDLVDKYTFKNSKTFSFKDEVYLIKVGTVDGCIDFVYLNMRNKKDSKSYEINARNYDLVDCFYDVLNIENNFKDENSIINENFQNFILNLNKLNIYGWASNYESYKNSLVKQEMINACENAHSFFVSNFRG